MSVADQTPVAGYTGNGVTTAFSFPFTALAEGDVSVMVAGLLLTLNVHYTVSGVGGASGTVTFTSAPASLASIVIYRDSDLTRATDYQDNGDLLAATLNRDLDRLWLALQEILSGSKTNPRTVRAPIGETLADLPAASARAGNLLGFDLVTGQPIAVAPVSGSAADLALNLASPASGNGAALVGIQDSLGAYTSTNTEGALQEIAARAYGANVLDPRYGAKGDGVTDDTAAFNAAAATGKLVYVPVTAGGYSVANITLSTNMVFIGERSGLDNGPRLLVNTNNAGAFLNSAVGNCAQIEIKNFAILPKAGVTGARGYLQTNKDAYLSYCIFENIETYIDLLWGYDGFFIFCDWINCRDGYAFAYSLTQGHGFINCVPASFSQANEANVNTITRCKIFNSYVGTASIVAAMDIGHANQWSFESCDFEALNSPFMRARGLYVASFTNCWFERITAAYNCILDVSPSPAVGTRPVSFVRCFMHLGNTTTGFATIGSASNVDFERCNFNHIPAGVVLANSAAAVSGCLNTEATGAGGAGFLAGVNQENISGGKRFINTATDNGSGAATQIGGIVSASGGFLSSRAVAVSASAVQIAAVNLTGGLAFINGFNTTGGASGWWLVAWNSGGVATVISAINNTTLTVAFTVVSGQLNMNTTAGTLNVNVAVLV